MSDSTKVFVAVPWNIPITPTAVGFARAQSMLAQADWFERRLDIWTRYSMPSLARQSYQDFVVYVLCDPVTAVQNDKLQSTFIDKRFRLVNGSMYQVVDQLMKEGSPEDLFVCGRMDSDDMYHGDLLGEFVRLIPEAQRLGKPFIQAACGYALNLESRKVYRWNNPTPSFLCCLVQRKLLLSSITTIWCDHGKVAVQAVRIMPRPLFCVTMNGLNIFNVSTCCWVGEEVIGAELEQVKKDYGL